MRAKRPPRVIINGALVAKPATGTIGGRPVRHVSAVISEADGIDATALLAISYEVAEAGLEPVRPVRDTGF